MTAIASESRTFGGGRRARMHGMRGSARNDEDAPTETPSAGALEVWSMVVQR